MIRLSSALQKIATPALVLAALLSFHGSTTAAADDPNPSELSTPAIFQELAGTAPSLSESNRSAQSANEPFPAINAASPPATQPPAVAPPAEQPAVEPSVETAADAAATLLKTADLTGSERIGSTVKIALLLSVLSLVPAILMMTTSFVRIVTVLSILRQGLGTGQIPPTQVLTAIAVFLTLLVMTPTLTEVWTEAVEPYSAERIDASEALTRGEKPIRTFLWKQIERSGNTDAIWLFMRYVPGAEAPKYYEDIPWRALLPAFMLSELKTAFLIGFQILIPFLVIDLIVSGVMVSMGMMMLPPAVVSLPLKLMLFVLADGWTLVVKSLLDGFVIGG